MLEIADIGFGIELAEYRHPLLSGAATDDRQSFDITNLLPDEFRLLPTVNSIRIARTGQVDEYANLAMTVDQPFDMRSEICELACGQLVGSRYSL